LFHVINFFLVLAFMHFDMYSKEKYKLLWPLYCFFNSLVPLSYILILLQGEEYKLFWPDQQEFVRTAARFGATIVPFGTVGEDDLTHVSLCFLSFPKT